ncbi:alpha/beta hydrolase [Altericroceibacterium spongiae]|uniref:Palmitoyl-protein thioesterase ABHD10, mitochondrial n=1 Tax=Altericroceibacterium spongiae TaxID=2320269 RepID=A0A420EP88_9SPHN|nr:alpha/beta hydrolase [Altericroceibacterium spongiae]RKF22490.1 alpha/beta hydrolase [Altericroceibacterium spongiae]
MAETQFHDLPDGRRIAFRHTPGTGPALVFLPGYMSDMDGTKATTLFAWAQEQGREALLLDYSGCGQSSGDFADGALSIWRDEVMSLIGSYLSHPVLLVGSSMGGWLMLMVARALGNRLHAMVGIAAAPDFTSWGYDEAERARLAGGETLLRHNPYGPEPTPTHAKFWADGEANKQLTDTIPLACPVRLLHSRADSEVPPRISLDLADKLYSEDVQVTLIKGGDHRLSREGDIALLLRVVQSLIE